MEATLIQALHSARLTRREIQSLAARLPSSDEELNRLIDSLITSADDNGATVLAYAMISSGRIIEARRLPEWLPLINDLNGAATVALSAKGETVESLLTAVDSGMMGWEREGVSLMIAAWICLHREPKRELPATLFPKARMLARDIGGDNPAMLALYALARLTGDKGLQHVLEDQCAPPPADGIDAILEYLVEKLCAEPLYFLPEQMDRVIQTDGPLRRAAPKVGRNDPCPCGSGKKYKKCCFEKDQERLHHSTEIAGLTNDELEAMPEPFLTRERLENMRAPKLARLRIEMVPQFLQGLMLERLCLFRMTPVLLQAWEKVGRRPDLLNAWGECVDQAAQAGNRELVQRLVDLHGEPLHEFSLPFNAKLLLVQDQPKELLRLIEEGCRKTLEIPGDYAAFDAAFGLAEINLPGLATVVARGAAAVTNPYDAETLLDLIGKIRDRLNLPPEDPADWILDRHYELPEEIDESTREDLANAQRQIAAASAESNRLRTQLAETRAQLERQERLAARGKAAQNATPSAPVSAAGDASVEQLRNRVNELKSALKERHAERNALRRELNTVMAEAADLREKTSSSTGDAKAPLDPDHEEEALSAEESTPLQPLRLPVFPARFFQTLESFPENVSRSAMSLIGELAAGEPSAFVGMRRLRLHHEICRVRLAKDYRLLFKLHRETLEILDLINRRNFERWLKTLG